MASVKRLSLITKCLAALLAMASFPYDTKGVPNNDKNSTIAVFQDRNIARMKRQLTLPGCDCNPDSMINNYCCKVGDGTSVCCNIAGRNVIPFERRCENDSDCPYGWTCDLHDNICKGKPVGASCNHWRDCSSLICKNGICIGVSGDPCTEHSICVSKYCKDGKCSKCRGDGQCPGDLRCSYSEYCVDDISYDSCDDDTDCESNWCFLGRCGYKGCRDLEDVESCNAAVIKRKCDTDWGLDCRLSCERCECNEYQERFCPEERRICESGKCWECITNDDCPEGKGCDNGICY